MLIMYFNVIMIDDSSIIEINNDLAYENVYCSVWNLVLIQLSECFLKNGTYNLIWHSGRHRGQLFGGG